MPYYAFRSKESLTKGILARHTPLKSKMNRFTPGEVSMERMEQVEAPQTTKISSKAEQTRQRILDSALRLFATKGYERTTMREIATEAECSLGLAYRYFGGKDDMILELYRCLAADLEKQVDMLPKTSLANRFFRIMQTQRTLMAPYRDTIGALFGAALNPRSRVGVFGESTADMRRGSRHVFLTVAAGAKDAPRAAQLDDISTLLYGLHMLLLLFWLQNRSSDPHAIDEALSFVRDLLALLLPLFKLPPFSSLLARLARILGPMFGNP